MADPKITELREQTQALNEIKKIHGELSDAQSDELDSLRKKLKELRLLTKAQQKQADMATHLKSLEFQIKDNILDQTKGRAKLKGVLNQQLDIAINIAKNQQKLGQSIYKQIDFQYAIKDIETSRLAIQQNYWGANQELGQELLKDLAITEERLQVQKSAAAVQNVVHDKTEEMNGKLEEANQKWIDIKGQLIAIVSNPMTALKVGILAVVAGIGKGVMNLKEFADETGFSYAQMSKIGLATAFAGDEAKALLDEFGGISNITTKTLIGMKLLNLQYGISAEATSKMLGLMEGISGANRDTLLSQIKANSELARAEGLSPAQVMEDVASDTEFFAKFAKDGGDNLFKAAIEARKLGLSMDAISSSAESLLDFESSIEAQMEASILLGRQLNLDTARRLAFNGDLVGLQKELVNVVGTETQLNAMNVIQRKSMADAIGVSVEQMTKLVREQNKAGKSASFFEHSWVFIKEHAISVGAIMGGLLGLAIAFKAVLRGILSPAASAISASKDLAFSAGAISAGVAVGAGVGAYAKAKMANDIAIPAGGTSSITGPAGTFTLNPNDQVIAGTNLGGAFTLNPNDQVIDVPNSDRAQSMVDMSETNNLLSRLLEFNKEMVQTNKNLLEQNKQLMGGLTRSVKGLAID